MMSSGELKASRDHAELKVLEEKYLTAKRELSRVKSKVRRRELKEYKEYIDGLKVDMGWKLLDCEEYERGLTLLSSVPWRTHGEMKCNGMARALTALGYYEGARRVLERGLKRFPDSYALWVAMGALHECLGDKFEALRCLDIALQFAPEDNSAGLYNKALILMELGCYGDAIQIYNDLIEKDPEDPRYFADRGCCSLEMGYPQEALQFYQQARDIWQHRQGVYDGVCIYSGLCSAYFELGMKKEAMEIALEGLKKFPDEDPILYQNVGASYFQMGWDKEAIGVLKKGIEKFPNDEELKKFLKAVEEDMDDPDSGEKPPLLSLILLMGLIRKKLKNFRK